MDTQPISQILGNALSIDKQIREEAEKFLEKKALENFPEFLYNLGTELSDESKPNKIRQMAATYMKNSIVYVEEFREMWIKGLESKVKNQIKMLVLATLASSMKEIRSAAGLVIAGICKIDLPLNEKWPGLIESLCQNTYNVNISMRLAAIETLGYLCEELTPKAIDHSSINGILSALIQNLREISNEEVTKASLKAFYHTIRFSEKHFGKTIIMEAIFMVGNNYSTNDDILECIAMVFIEMGSLSSNYDNIADYISKIAEFTFYIIKNKIKDNEKLVLLAYEIWCTLGEEELARSKLDNTQNLVFSQNSTTGGYSLTPSQTQSTKPFRRYFSKYHQSLLDIISSNVSPSLENTKEWNISKASFFLLDVLVQVIETEVMEKLLKTIEQNLHNTDPSVKCKAILLFSGSVNTTHKGKMTDLLTKQITKIFKELFNENENIKKATSILINKIAKHFPRLFDHGVLATVIPTLLNALSSKNELAINICNALSNLIKGLGDSETKKSSNHISPYFENIFKELVANAFREGAFNKDYNLTMSCFVTIGMLIEYSSHDKQDKLFEMLVFFLTYLETTVTTISTLYMNSSTAIPSTSIDSYFQLQAYYCNVLHAIFNKMIKKVQVGDAKKIFILLEQIFKQRQSVFDEANLAMGALAANMKETFEEIFESYSPFLTYSIQKYSEHSLCKSGLVALLTIVKVLNVKFSKYMGDYIKILIDVCTNSELSRDNKTIAISTLAEMAFSTGEHFLPYLDTVMTLLISACQLAVVNAEGDDEETDDFLKNLRFELIQAFTCIEFALEEKISLLVPYVPNIFAFFKTIVSDAFPQRADILKFMLSFITDMANAFGKEIKSICEKEFLAAVITKLKAFKIKKYEYEIIQQEEILKLVFD